MRDAPAASPAWMQLRTSPCRLVRCAATQERISSDARRCKKMHADGWSAGQANTQGRAVPARPILICVYQRASALICVSKLSLPASRSLPFVFPHARPLAKRDRSAVERGVRAHPPDRGRAEPTSASPKGSQYYTNLLAAVLARLIPSALKVDSPCRRGVTAKPSWPGVSRPSLQPQYRYRWPGQARP
jgi:hypothetical protein